MSYTKLIHDYLDGGVDSTQEAMLFDMLSKDSELRADFNKQMKLHLIAQQDMNHISPPAEATNELFGRLGFTVPDYLDVPAPSIADKVTGYIKKYGVMALLLLLTSAVSVVLTTNYDNMFDSSNNQATVGDNAENNSVPVVSSFETESTNTVSDKQSQNSNLTNQLAENMTSANNNQYSQIANRYGLDQHNNIPSDIDNNNTLDVSSSEEENANTSIYDKIVSWFDSKPESTFDTDDHSSLMASSTDPATISEMPFSPFSSTISLPSAVLSEDTKYELGFKYISEAANNDYSHLAINNQFYDNVIISGMYHFSDNHSVGLEMGWERFAQSFTTSYYGEVTEQKQYPRRFLAGMSYRFTYTNLFGLEYVSPYSEIFAGGSSLGPIGKLNAGIRFTPINNISMNLGYEYGFLYYSVDNKTYNSEKQGFVYRISYNF